MQDEYEVVPQDEPSLEDYPQAVECDCYGSVRRVHRADCYCEQQAAESAQIEKEAQWSTEAEAEEARLREWGVK